MKTLIASLIATCAAVSTLHAHCGSCSMDEMHGDAHGDHAKCYSGTMDAYFSIQKALAGDNLDDAKLAAAKLEGNIANSECAMDGGDCCAEVTGAADAISEADSLAAARSAFNGFSQAMIARVESHRPDETVYQMYCPMALNNKGAAWLQNSEDLRNPYFGSSMLTCGMTKATYGAE